MIKYINADKNKTIMMYSESYGYDRGYFCDLKELQSYCDEEKIEMPKVVYGTDRIMISIDAKNIIENACEELYEDAFDVVGEEDIEELNVLLKNWSGRQDWSTSYAHDVDYPIDISEFPYEARDDAADRIFESLKFKAGDQFLFEGEYYRIDRDANIFACPDEKRDTKVISEELFNNIISSRGMIRAASWMPLFYCGADPIISGDKYYYVDYISGKVMNRIYCNDMLDRYLKRDINYFQTAELAESSSIKKNL